MTDETRVPEANAPEADAAEASAKRVRTTEVLMLRNYQLDEQTRLEKGTVYSVPSSIVGKLVKAKLATRDIEDAA